jgi:hypothetical protein
VAEMLMHANEIIINVFETEISTKSNSNVLSNKKCDLKKSAKEKLIHMIGKFKYNKINY